MMASPKREKPWGARLAALIVVSGIAAPALGQHVRQRVSEARDHADRAAQVESAIRALERDGSNADALAQALAAHVRSAALQFAPPPLAPVPDDWTGIGLSLENARIADGKFVYDLDDGYYAVLTIDVKLQQDLEKLFVKNAVPHGSAVLVEPATGRVRALVSHSSAKPRVENLALKALAPSASVFKVITAAALLESGGVKPGDSVCYHGGRSRLSARNIRGDAKRDRKCADLGSALAWSINSIMAKLAYKRLSREDLQEWARKFGYNTALPFEMLVEESTAEFVEDPLERARTAAGFWHTFLTPLHGALIGAAVQNDGVMMRPTLIAEIRDAAGHTVYRSTPRVLRRVMAKETADVLASLLEQTVSKGTARRYFRRKTGAMKDVVVAGKTGTLSNKKPYLGFTWFVGFATKDRDPKRAIAVAGLACNSPKWRIKGTHVASEAIRRYFERTGSATVASLD
jgi:penicillin-binding protein A